MVKVVRLIRSHTTKQQKNGNLGDIEEKSNLIKLKVCEKDFMKQIWFPPRVPILSFHYFQFFCLVTIFSVDSKELELELEQSKKIAIPVFIKELGKYIQKRIDEYVNIES